VVMSEFAPIFIYLVISPLVSLIPLGVPGSLVWAHHMFTCNRGKVLMASRFSTNNRRFFFAFLIMFIVIVLCYVVCLGFGCLDYFFSTLGRALLFSGFRLLVGPSFSGVLVCILFSRSYALSGELAKQMNPSYREDSFGIRVLMEPFSETEMEGTSTHSSIPRVDEAGLTHNASLESSIRNRIIRLEQVESPYLLGKEKGMYWGDIKLELDQAPSQREYNRLLEFENVDLNIREKKTESFLLFKAVLGGNPALAGQAPYKPQEVFNDFLDQHANSLENEKERDRLELHFLDQIIKELKQNGDSGVRKIFKEMGPD
jgi:hypothetical protein